MSKKKSSSDETSIKTMERPMICAIDFDDSDIESLKDTGFYICQGSLGRKLNHTNSSDYSLFKSKLDIPGNLHEFDFVLFDYKERPIVDCETDDSDVRTSAKSNHFIHVSEERIFDPIPLSAAFNRESLGNHPVQHVVFAGRNNDVNYTFCKSDGGRPNRTEERTHSSNLLYAAYFGENKKGNQTTVVDSPFMELLTKYNGKMYYECTFDICDYHKNVAILMTNKHDEAISYCYASEDSLILVFPQMDRKREFLHDLFANFLPELLPELFPDFVKAAWKNNPLYILPNQQQLFVKKEELKRVYNEEIRKLEEEIAANNSQFSFLHDLITGTGDQLVQALITYLRWLGFDRVVDKDKENPSPNGHREEDIQIKSGNGLIVIECKGIGGTSKDEDCSQILKIINRRKAEGKASYVNGLYIVNHQRRKAPHERENPPFTPMQTRDAELEKRGLLTTWELFKLFFIVEENAITKKAVRKSLLKYGHILPIEENLTYIGNINKVYNSGHIAIFDLENSKIQTGETLLYNSGQHWKQVEVISIQLNDESVDSIESGEIGVQFNDAVSERGNLYKVKNEESPASIGTAAR